MAVEDKVLRTLKLSQELVTVWRDGVSDEDLTGVVSGFSDEFLYLSLFAESGIANGIAIVYRGHITRMRWQGNERRALAQLVAMTGATPIRPAISLDSIEAVLRGVNEAFGYVNVLTERVRDSIAFIGEIVDLDRQSLVLDTYGTFSSRDRGQLLLACDEITRVDADAPYERSVSYLAHNNLPQS